jgi:tryptophan-rich sensory protein
VIFAAACQLPGALGVLATATGDSAWYRELAKPAFQPPGWVFGPVWTLLYALMGVAAWRVWRLGTAAPGVRPALVWFAIQLAINAAWTPVFFGAHAIVAALIVLVALWVALVATIAAFRRVDVPATLLLIPYLVWVSFAVVLNAAIASLN